MQVQKLDAVLGRYWGIEEMTLGILEELLWGGSERLKVRGITWGGLGHKGIEGALLVVTKGNAWVVLRR